MEVNLDEDAEFTGSIPPVAKATASTTNGVGVNVGLYQQATVLLVAGAFASGLTVTVNIQESSDDGDSDAYSNITGAQFVITETPVEDNALWVGQINLSGREKWLRATAAVTGGSGGDKALFTVVFALNGKAAVPVTQDKAIEFQV